MAEIMNRLESAVNAHDIDAFRCLLRGGLRQRAASTPEPGIASR